MKELLVHDQQARLDAASLAERLSPVNWSCGLAYSCINLFHRQKLGLHASKVRPQLYLEQGEDDIMV